MTDGARLPQRLLDLWGLGDREMLAAIRSGELGEVTASALLKSYLRTLLDDHDYHEAREHKPPSLTSIALESMLGWLNSSDDLYHTAQLIASSLNVVTLRDFLMNPRMRYPVLRACLDAANEGLEEGRSMIDVDEAVLANERYIRSIAEHNRDNAYLVTLEDLCETLSISSYEGGIGLLPRPNPPRGGVEFLNFKRKDYLLLHASSADFAKSLDQVTGKELCGLDWSNVLMAGDLVIQILLYRQGSSHRDASDDIGFSPIDLYLYGLDVHEANKKVEEIHEVWASNLPAADQSKIVVKDATNICFFAKAPYRPVRIRTRLFKCLTEALLGLEPRAIGFDGSQVIMLPRCARALETGYLVLTMDYLWCRQSDDREAKINCLFEHADLGFGIRLLPSYVKALEGRASDTSLKQLLSLELAKPDGMVYIGDDLPEQRWAAADFVPYWLAHAIDGHNDRLFSALQEAICDRLRIPLQTSGCKYFSKLTSWRSRKCSALHHRDLVKAGFCAQMADMGISYTDNNYLTRRIRRQV